MRNSTSSIILVGRIGEVLDVAQAVAYLAGDTGSFLTGVLLPIDGGITLTGKGQVKTD